MSEDQPESTTSWAASAPATALAAPRASWKLWVGRVVALLGVAAFTGLGIVRTDQSMDLPWGGNDRYGFYQNGLPVQWVCPDGHDHWSLPFWMGAAAFAVPAAIWWLVYPRRRG
jgi:hypothetical protein